MLADSELPEVIIEPSNYNLDDVMRNLESDRGRHLDLTLNQRIALLQLNSNGSDFVDAVGCGVLPDRTHQAASLAG
jgi:hypothetical protein